MDRKLFLFIGLSVLTILIGLPLMLKQDWRLFSDTNPTHQLLADTVNNINLFDENNESNSLAKTIADSAYILFRFPPNTCSCLEADFAEAIGHAGEYIGDNRIFVIIAANEPKDIYYFRERTRLSCPVYGTADTLLPAIDAKRMPYACVVFPDMTARNISSTHPNNIKEIITYAKKTIH